jgi:hypothetical protein
MVKIKDISGRDNRQCKNPEVRRSLMLRTRERRLSGVREHDIEREREQTRRGWEEGGEECGFYSEYGLSSLWAVTGDK